MATFAAYVIVHGESGPVQFAPGDDVPEWADGLVGDHCLTEPRAKVEPELEAPVVPPAEPPVEPVTPPVDPEAPTVPDFTGAKPQAQRRTRS